MSNYSIPGVYVEEINSLPPTVAAVATAVPIFVGYTARQPTDNKPTPIGGYLGFVEIFGEGRQVTVTGIRLTDDKQFIDAELTQSHYLQSALQLFYANGGGRCYIMSIGTPPGDGTLAAVNDGDITPDLLKDLATFDEPTIVVFPDHPGSTAYDDILQHCRDTKDRVAVLDTKTDDYLGANLRNQTGTEGLSYGAAYTPWLRCALPKGATAASLQSAGIEVGGTAANLNSVITDADPTVKSDALSGDADAEAQLRAQSAIYRNILRGLDGFVVPIPPSGAVAGIYAAVDAARGVWKAPANVSLNGVAAPDERFTQDELKGLNVDATAGKSINAIRHFTGKGTLIYGARTLAGNDGEYKYISVRRLMNMIEESCAKACEQFVFEPNVSNTWIRVRAMIENFLELVWRDGGLQGATPEEAFRVRVGLGVTMTAAQVAAGTMIVSVSVAPVRPAEFIVLQFKQHLPTS